MNLTELQAINYEEELYDVRMGKGGSKLLHDEHWSNPDAETYLTGIDYYDHPRLCRLKLRELYPMFHLGIPEKDDPKPRPKMGGAGQPTSNKENHTVRWGDSESGTFQHGEAFFKDAEEVLAWSPLEHADFRAWPHVVNNWDCTSEEVLYQNFRKGYPKEWGDKAPERSNTGCGIYNTMFMWPLLCFGWELFLECALEPRFERVMEEFAEINRRIFRAFARLPVNFVHCHDDIVMTRGPVCSPQWMHKYIFPRYEEFWGIVKASGKEVFFTTDGCADAYADDVLACGARGIITEPYTNFKAIAKKHKDVFLSGEGDSRILNRNNPDEIRAMVESMVETSKMTRGYMLGCGNHIPWNVNPQGVKCYLDLCNEIGYR